MKYLRLLKKYIFIFVGAALFGLAAVKLSSANRGERKANDKVRELTLNSINITSHEIDQSINSLKDKQAKNKEAKDNAFEKLDRITKHSGSVTNLLDEYNHDRV